MIQIVLTPLLFQTLNPGLVIADALICFTVENMEQLPPQMLHSYPQFLGGRLVVLDGLDNGLVCLRCIGDLGFRKDLIVVRAQAQELVIFVFICD